MATETYTLALTGKNVKASDYTNGDKLDDQIVTLTDGGDFDGKSFKIQGDKQGADGSGGGNDYFKIDLSGCNDSFDLTLKSMMDGDTFEIRGWDTHTVDGTLHTYTYTGSDGASHTFTIDAASKTGTVNVIWFARGTGILCADGREVPVERLQAGDKVRCGDGQARVIRWIGSRRLNGADLSLHRELRPVRIAPDALGPGAPARPVRLSPQHRVALHGWRAELMCGAGEVLAAAVHLVNDSTIRIDTEIGEVDYFHLLLDGHHTVLADGLEAETLFFGGMALEGLGGAARGEIAALFPDLAADVTGFGPTALPVAKRFEAALLMAGS